MKNWGVGKLHALRLGLALAPVVSAGLWIAPAAAQTVETSATVDVTAGGSSNPFLLTRSDPSSGYAQVNVDPQVRLVDGSTTAILDAFYRRTQYFRLYDATDAYGATLSANGQLSARMTVRTIASYTSSIVGENGLDARTGPTTPTPGAGSIPIDPTDISLIGLRTRDDTWSITSGFDWQNSARDFVSFNAAATGTKYGTTSLPESRAILLSGSYARAMTERTRIGVSMQGQWQDFGGDGNNSTIFQPRATLSTQLASRWTFNGGIGALIINSRTLGISQYSVGVSGEADLCRQGEKDNFCLQAFRDADASAFGSINKRFGVVLSYSYRLTEKDKVQVSGNYTRLDRGSVGPLVGTDSYLNGQIDFDHRFTQRFSLSADAAYRRSNGSGFGGFGARDDISVSISLHTRFGKYR